MRKQKKEWKRNCPECGEELTYKYAQSYCTAKNKNKVCRSCSKKGSTAWNKGVPRRKETREKISKTRIERKIPSWNEGLTKETDIRLKLAGEKISKKLKGNTQPIERNKRRSETMKRRIEEHGHWRLPNYNRRAIVILEQKAKELGIDDLQHAENGGEFRVPGSNYYVDGYSEEKNIVIEYYETRHQKQIEYDDKRQKEIIEHLGCEFLIIKEW
jgi:hypothetical protein